MCFLILWTITPSLLWKLNIQASHFSLNACLVALSAVFASSWIYWQSVFLKHPFLLSQNLQIYLWRFEQALLLQWFLAMKCSQSSLGWLLGWRWHDVGAKVEKWVCFLTWILDLIPQRRRPLYRGPGAGCGCLGSHKTLLLHKSGPFSIVVCHIGNTKGIHTFFLITF